jgi:mannan endo-1,4-beta-mannosidase
MRQTILIIFLICIGAFSLSGQNILADKNATEKTKDLYAFLWKIQNKNFTLFGHHDALAYGHGWRDRLGYSDVFSMVGTHPAVCSLDFGKIEHKDSININRIPFDKMREIVGYAYKNGQVIMFCWHVDNPKTYRKGAEYPVGTSWDNSDNAVVKEILTENSKLNILFKTWLDNLAEYIYTLKDDNGEPIPFIFRPWHEHTQVWNWWGRKCATDREFIGLWRFTVAYLRDVKEIHQMIYAISPQMDEIYENTKDRLAFRWPGDEYVDFLGMDCYHGRNYRALESNLHSLSELSGEKGKPCGITEIGLEGVPYDKYFTQEILPPIEKNKLSLFVFWRNDDIMATHHFLPYKGHKAETDFIEFCNSEKIVLNDEIEVNEYGFSMKKGK